MKELKEYRKNIYSQNGEDGVIEEILHRLNIKEGTFVEFGAWDGIHFSNTYNLLKNKNWSGLYIEGDKEKYQDLLKNMKPFGEKVQCLNAVVETSGENGLDSILKKFKFKKEFTLLSIDIDSYDFHVWESCKKFTPKIVIIEIDTSFPPGIMYVYHEANQKLGSHNIANPMGTSFTSIVNHMGTSFTSMVNLGKKKGYTPIYCHGNLFFVKNQLLPKLSIPSLHINHPETLFSNELIGYQLFNIIMHKLIFLNRFYVKSGIQKIVKMFSK